MAETTDQTPLPKDEILSRLALIEADLQLCEREIAERKDALKEARDRYDGAVVKMREVVREYSQPSLPFEDSHDD